MCLYPYPCFLSSTIDTELLTLSRAVLESFFLFESYILVLNLSCIQREVRDSAGSRGMKITCGVVKSGLVYILRNQLDFGVLEMGLLKGRSSKQTHTYTCVCFVGFLCVCVHAHPHLSIFCPILNGRLTGEKHSIESFRALMQCEGQSKV